MQITKEMPVTIRVNKKNPLECYRCKGMICCPFGENSDYCRLEDIMDNIGYFEPIDDFQRCPACLEKFGTGELCK